MLNLCLFVILSFAWGAGCFIYLFEIRDTIANMFVKSFLDCFFSPWMLVIQTVILLMGELWLAKL